MAFITKERHAFGNPNDQWTIKDYTFAFDTVGDPFATMPFTFGKNWEASYCGGSECARPYVGMGTSLAPEGEFIDLSGATGVSFKIKSRSAPLKVIFKVHTYDTELDSTPVSLS